MSPDPTWGCKGLKLYLPYPKQMPYQLSYSPFPKFQSGQESWRLSIHSEMRQILQVTHALQLPQSSQTRGGCFAAWRWAPTVPHLSAPSPLAILSHEKGFGSSVSGQKFLGRSYWKGCKVGAGEYKQKRQTFVFRQHLNQMYNVHYQYLYCNIYSNLYCNTFKSFSGSAGCNEAPDNN